MCSWIYQWRLPESVYKTQLRRTINTYKTAHLKMCLFCWHSWIIIACFTAIDACSLNPCTRHGYCTNIGSSYQCSCHQRFTGHDCETGWKISKTLSTVDGACSSIAFVLSNKSNNKNLAWHSPLFWFSILAHGLKSVFGSNLWTCCCVELDPCELNPCLNGGSCYISGFHYSCQCVAGYQGFNCEGENFEILLHD